MSRGILLSSLLVLASACGSPMAPTPPVPVPPPVDAPIVNTDSGKSDPVPPPVPPVTPVPEPPQPKPEPLRVMDAQTYGGYFPGAQRVPDHFVIEIWGGDIWIGETRFQRDPIPDVLGYASTDGAVSITRGETAKSWRWIVKMYGGVASGIATER